MIECSFCNKLVKIEDFMGKDRCYKCEYQRKLKIIPKKGCKICGKPRPPKKISYCSTECARIAYLDQMKNYWVKNLAKRSEKVSWKENMDSNCCKQKKFMDTYEDDCI